MRKLALHPDDLRVESFATLPAAAPFRHTVHAHQDDAGARSGGVNCKETETCNGGFTCDGGMSCDFKCTDESCKTCPETCEQSCGATCLSGGPCCDTAAG